ncbi:hypothetical protein QEN19_000868 [Hanseniaspora menglaensis]
MTADISKDGLLKIFKINYLKKDANNISSLEITNCKIIAFKDTYRLVVSRNNGVLEHWEFLTDLKQWINLSIINHSNINDSLSSNTIEDFVYFIDPITELERLFTINGNEFITEYDLNNKCIKKQHLINVTSDSNCIIWSINVNFKLNKLIIGLTNNNIQIYDLSQENSNELIYNSQLISSVNNDEKILSISFIDNDKHIITGTSLGKIKILSYENNNLIQLLKTLKIDNKKPNNNKKHKHNNKIPIVWCLEYIPKYNLIVSGDSNGDLKLWDFKTNTLLQSLTTNNNSNNNNKKISKVDILNLTYNEANDAIYTTSLDKKISMFKFLKKDDSVKLHLLTSRLINKSLFNADQGYDLRGLHSLENFLIVGNDKGEIQIFNKCGAFNSVDSSNFINKLPIQLKQDDLLINGNLVYNLINDSCLKIYSLRGKLLSKLKISQSEAFIVNKSNELLVIYDNTDPYAENSNTSVRCFFLEQIGDDKDNLEGVKVTKLPLENLPFRNNLNAGKKHDSLSIKSIQFLNDNQIIILYQYSTFDFNGNVTNNNEIYNYDIEEMESKKIEIVGYFEEDDEDEEAEEEFQTILVNAFVSLPDNNKILVTSDKKIVLLHKIQENTYRLQNFYELSQNSIAICKYNIENDTLLIVTKNFKLLQLSLKDGKQTNWSIQNYESFPKIVLNDIHKSTVISDLIYLPGNKFMLCSNNWILTINMNKNLPMKSKKRKLNEILDNDGEYEGEEESNDDAGFFLITKFNKLYKIGIVSQTIKETEVFLVNDYLDIQTTSSASQKIIGNGKYKF